MTASQEARLLTTYASEERHSLASMRRSGEAAKRRQSSGPDEPRLEPSSDLHLEFELTLLALLRDFLKHARSQKSQKFSAAHHDAARRLANSTVNLLYQSRVLYRWLARLASAAAAAPPLLLRSNSCMQVDAAPCPRSCDWSPHPFQSPDRQSANAYRERIGGWREARRGMQPFHPYEQPPPFLGESMQSHHHSCCQAPFRSLRRVLVPVRLVTER